MGKGLKVPKITVGKDQMKQLTQVAAPIAASALLGPAGGMAASSLMGGGGGGGIGGMLGGILGGGAGQQPGAGGFAGMLGGLLGGGGGGGFLGSLLSNPNMIQSLASGDFKGAAMAALGSLGPQLGISPQLVNGLVGGGFQAGRGEVPQGEGFTDAFGNFVGRNQGFLGTALQGAGSYANYDQWKKRWEERRKALDRQQADIAGAGADYQAMKFDPERYTDYRKFLEDRVAGQGIGAAEKKMQQEGDIRAGRSAAGQRAAALEQMARMGMAGATGSGAALASALAGGQSAMDILSQTNLTREASAQENLERALARKSDLSTQQTREEAALAGEQAIYRLNQLGKLGDWRSAENALLSEIGEREGNMLSDLADAGTSLLGKYESPAARKKRKEQEAKSRKMEALKSSRQSEIENLDFQLKQAELDKRRAEIDALKNQGRVPSGQTSSTYRTTPPPPGPTQSQINQALNRGSYTIRRDDTLGKRYRDLGYNSWQEAYEANRDLIGDNPNLIREGGTLRRKDELEDTRVSTPVQDMNRKYTIA